MVISRVQANWSGVTFNAITLTRITAGGFDQGGNISKFKADVDLYTSLVAVLDIEPSASFTSADVGTFMQLVPGTDSTLVATLNDAKLVTAGGVEFTVAHAVFEKATSSGSHGAFGTVTGTWQIYTPDGVTPPVAITRV